MAVRKQEPEDRNRARPSGLVPELAGGESHATLGQVRDDRTLGHPAEARVQGQAIAYLRVSTRRQDVEMQRAALAKLEPARWFEDVASGKVRERQGLEAALAYMRPGDTFIVYSLSRASRSLRDLLDLITGLEERGVHFRSLLEPQIDTSSPTGRLVFGVLAVLAQYERELTVQRVKDGQAARKAAGLPMGRKPKLDTAERVTLAQEMRAGGQSIAGIARALNVSRTAVRRALR